MTKTNAMRRLDAAKIKYEVKEYEVDESDLSGIHIAEQDGTADFHAKITLQKAPALAEPPVAEESVSPTPRPEPVEAKSTVTERTVKKGENLWTICREVYSDGSLCHKLATYNGIQNANVIFAGQVLKLPPAADLQKGATA